MPWTKNNVFVADENDTKESMRIFFDHQRKVRQAKKYVCPFCHKKVCYVIDGKFECPECEMYGFDPNKIFKKHK